MELIALVDGNDFSSYVGWEGLNEVIRWDNANLMYIPTFDGSMTFIEDAYNYFYSKVTDNDICNVVTCKVWFNGVQVINGNIFITECIFNETKRTVEVKVNDAGYGARIQNNRGIDVAFDQTTTKNGNAIMPVSVAFTTCFDPIDGTALTDNCKAYRVNDVFAYLVEWMTDDNVAFQSDYFSTGAGNVWRVTSGINLRMRDGAPIAPKVSLSDLFDTFRKLLRVGMGFDVAPDGRPRIRIEPESFFRDSVSSVTLYNTDNVELSFVQEVLFASVRVGCVNITRPQDCDSGNSVCATSTTINYFGCDEEQYGLTGTCNIDAELNLQPNSKFIYDTNTIEDITIYGNDSYDNDVILIQVEANSALADDSDPLGIGQHWYNGEIMNDKVLARWQDYLLGSLSLFSLQSGYGLFSADTFNSGVLLPNQTPTFTDYVVDPTVVAYNPDSAWSNVTNRFTTSFDGVFMFRCGTTLEYFPASPIGVTISTQLNVDHYDSGGTLINRYSSAVLFYVTGDPATTYTYTTPFISMEATDYCIYTISYAQSLPTGVSQAEIVYGNGTASDDYFTLIDSRAAQGDVQVNSGANLAYVKRSFSRPISESIYNTIRANPFSKITLQDQDGTKQGWIGMISRKFVNQQTDVEILSIP